MKCIFPAKLKKDTRAVHKTELNEWSVDYASIGETHKHTHTHTQFLYTVCPINVWL